MNSCQIIMSQTLRDIEGKDFTGGLSTEDYLEKLREGELG